ncbi:hypothetical protein A3B21_02805 [Candidatus Uhrbacteria bacterium RIFCSPLOWO2_01_FULL_47_24]|uniref:Colicin V production protein n=1 Tax=Candidatus Uhrbacteria bacterium RIFCSPLOWO2_01_FULL_47_24 TaxID=1802401 RepID=A0A1F7UTZ2_9BACT|nr:MAG: hypothetical protein A3D58_01830 [Candidatus Uhrbacteria bacterium RIFCSPHIGHO2_02_FULL_46_47]OGL74710.1 MAG: hypothetical protein A3F52_00095 [Candidatus Uhrbacteria bacterium RIFCSPHIGHO2_12_FULL_47_11]OGL81194.1 MAG: hypothetical protein A3B21_02805 [Candidatus Uhrbacteria bacterium RIFCSPLOWO2_01_FULL_47_24]OGL84641.1 MAG: hypothetical protein A3J03_02450 [Candidatus Uhrbacteria bacterium RIFCSPLOWO2_02_FULL_46_25]OGL93202.1 MAG: hypothetical protein A3H11_01310 [Candidatus Uhrbacte
MLGGIQQLVSSINWSRPSWDLFIFLFFFIIAFLYGFSLGRDRILVILVSIYIALAVVPAFPYLDRLHLDVSVQGFAFRVTSFYIVFVVLFFLLSRSALVNLLGAQNTGVGDRLIEVIIFSILHVGLLVSVTLSFLPQNALMQLSTGTREVFTSDMGKFLWLVAPVIAMIISSHHRWRRGGFQG